jgi:integrase
MEPVKPKRKLPPNKPKNKARRAREYLTPEEVAHLIDSARALGRHGVRDAALILMAYRHALRVGEIVSLRWGQINMSEKKLQVIRLKSGKPSVHSLDADEIDALTNLRLHGAADCEFVFRSERGGPLGNRSVHVIVARAGRMAGVDFSVHPHMLRHSMGYQLAARGVDVETIRAYLGHRDAQYTIKYNPSDRDSFEDFDRD